MAANTTRRLFVEGPNDLFAITHLVNRRFDAKLCSVSAEKDSLFVQAFDGIANLLAQGTIEAAAKTYERLGIVVDADADVQARWQQVACRLSNVGIDIPKTAASEGVIVPGTRANFRVGVWLMPDNVHPGALEMFLQTLVNPNDCLWPIADVSTTNAEEAERRFAKNDGMKARLHAWLAWQAKPGVGVGPAIDSGFLNPMSPAADAFMHWFERTFA